MYMNKPPLPAVTHGGSTEVFSVFTDTTRTVDARTTARAETDEPRTSL